MVVISLEHSIPRIEGYLCRHMYKLRPGVFAGRLSASRRDKLWRHILFEQPDIDAVMCYDDAHKTVSFLTNGNPTRYISEEDGLPFLSFLHTKEEVWKLFLAKKAHSDTGRDKPLWEHMIETGYMAYTVLTDSAYYGITDLLMAQTDCIDKVTFISTLCFYISMHDIGKVHHLFQGMLTGKGKLGFRHEIYSRYILRDMLYKHGIKRKTDYSSMYRLCDIVGDHHQCKEDKADLVYEDELKKDKAIVDAITGYVEKIFPYTLFNITGDENLFCQLVSGLLRLSDWSASAFADDLCYYEDEKKYLEDVKDRCRKYIQEGGLMPWEPEASYPYHRLFPFLSEDTLHPLQKSMISVIKEHPSPDCILIEDQPGSGKTETAIYAAMNIMKATGKQGLYFALPTGATAEAMLPRLKALQDTGLFTDTQLKLFTGMAWMRDTSDEDAEDKAEWTKSGSRKLFSKFACGTVDQLMAAGEALKAGDMRLLGLSDKVIIIDEMHAYDAYMMDILGVTLKWLYAMKVPVIILSATLQISTKKEIFEIFANDVSDCDCMAYPRITVAEDKKTSIYLPETAVEKTYDMETIQETEAVGKVIASVVSGGNTLYIANTVPKAYKICTTLMSKADADTQIRLYTARTEPGNKEKMGEELVYLYGKKGKQAGERPTKTIVVATQICEMSMDVDFDTLFSELAPVDSLIQRIGREKRHDDKGTVREKGFKSIFYLVIPEKTGEWWHPYSEAVLTSTEKVLSGRSWISIPDGISPLIEKVYTDAGAEWQKEIRTKKANAKIKEMDKPREKYWVRTDLMTRSVTRYKNYETINVICLPDEEKVQNDKEWCARMIKDHSVSLPSYIYDKIEKSIVLDKDDKKPVWIKGYAVIKDREEYHGWCHVFIGGIG